MLGVSFYILVILTNTVPNENKLNFEKPVYLAVRKLTLFDIFFDR